MSTGQRVSAAAGAVALTLAAATGCSSSSPESPAQPTASQSASLSSSTGTPGPTGVPVDFDVRLSSSYSRLTKVGKKDSQTYGLNIYDGSTTINDKSVRVRMLATVDYTNGNGPLNGFLELTWSDGTELGFRQEGEVGSADSTGTTPSSTRSSSRGSGRIEVNAKLTVIGGTDDAEGTSGTGEFTGSRSTTAGSSMNLAVTLHLINAPEMITGEPRSSGSTSPTSTYSATLAP